MFLNLSRGGRGGGSGGGLVIISAFAASNPGTISVPGGAGFTPTAGNCGGGGGGGGNIIVYTLSGWSNTGSTSPPVAHIHLRDATIHAPGAEPLSGTLWRGRLSHVSGWSLGVFSPSS